MSDEEVEEVVNHLKAYGPPEYKSGVVDEDDTADSVDLLLGLGGNTDGEDALYDQAVAIVIKDRKCSTSYIRKLAIGYNKAARLVEQMEDEGLVTPPTMWENAKFWSLSSNKSPIPLTRYLFTLV